MSHTTSLCCDLQREGGGRSLYSEKWTGAEKSRTYSLKGLPRRSGTRGEDKKHRHSLNSRMSTFFELVMPEEIYSQRERNQGTSRKVALAGLPHRILCLEPPHTRSIHAEWLLRQRKSVLVKCCSGTAPVKADVEDFRQLLCPFGLYRRLPLPLRTKGIRTVHDGKNQVQKQAAHKAHTATISGASLCRDSPLSSRPCQLPSTLPQHEPVHALLTPAAALRAQMAQASGTLQDPLLPSDAQPTLPALRWHHSRRIRRPRVASPPYPALYAGRPSRPSSTLMQRPPLGPLGVYAAASLDRDPRERQNTSQSSPHRALQIP